MSNLFLFLISIFLFFISIFLLLIYKGKFNQSKKKVFTILKPTFKEQENNPDFNTNDWHLHKYRLTKFGRSQYKGLTFFISSEKKIYYFSDKGTKVYC